MLRRDAASILHCHPRRIKYACKQTFDYCRECNQTFYTCISMAGYTYRACIDPKSYSELPSKLPTLPLLINPPPLHPPGNPEYWYSRLQPAVSLWMRPFDLYFLHVQYNFKQLPPCESCCPELTGTFNFTSFVLEHKYFLIISAASFFLSFFLFFLLFLLIYHKTLFDKVTGVGYRTIFVIYVIQPAKSINCLIYI